MYREAPELDPAWSAARLASAVLLVWVAVATDVPSVHWEAGQRPTEKRSCRLSPAADSGPQAHGVPLRWDCAESETERDGQ